MTLEQEKQIEKCTDETAKRIAIGFAEFLLETRANPSSSQGKRCFWRFPYIINDDKMFLQCDKRYTTEDLYIVYLWYLKNNSI